MASPDSDADRRVDIAKLQGDVSMLRVVLDEREKQVALALTSAEKASHKAEEAQAKVNATQNEFRGALKDQAMSLATKEDVERLVERVSNLEKMAAAGQGAMGGRGSAQALLLAILPIIVSLAALAAVFWK